MIKLTVLYGHPRDPDAFEKYYATTHMPLVGKIKGVAKAEVTKFLPNEDGSKPEYYRLTELYFESPEGMQAALGSLEGKATTDDLANFSTGGVKVLVGLSGKTHAIVRLAIGSMVTQLLMPYFKIV
ncbi:EthD family reductase [Algoriphagus sp. D3-2-R+10]|uniref:EthD family reductase n=1 Tax=Algoriphagus aurantiacus TaxID=3103948 RepID=UPI002B39DBF4|nr:EthD family reductase [Algoriphagus sp. D3-2-R+10]MEB2777057.1 EthD family reductase [Algoriphagus sp. D3-2-R+10]